MFTNRPPRLPVVITVLACVTIVFASTATVVSFSTLYSRSVHTTTEVRRMKALFVSEKICSASNQGACRSLFDRLAANLSQAQRFRLACDVLAALDVPEADRMHRVAECPPPIQARRVP